MTSSWSIRWKLTTWYIAALTVILLIFGGLMTAMMRQQLHQRIDSELREEAKELAEQVRDLNSVDEIRSFFQRRYSEHGGYSFQISRSSTPGVEPPGLPSAKRLDSDSQAAAQRADETVICGSPWLRAHSLTTFSSNDDTLIESLQDLSLAHLGLHRVLVRKISGSPEPLIIHVLVPYAQSQREFQEFIKILIIAGGIALLAACVGGLAIARRGLAPLERISRAAERISAENLSLSIVVENPQDELGRLAKTLNDTFQRLRDSVQRMQRFTADAAHELRTPLSVLRTRLEVALRLPIDAAQYRNSCQIAFDQADKLTTLIDQLLVLCRQDSGLTKALFDEVYLKPLVEDVVDILRMAADSKGVSLTLGEIPNCIICGDDISLSRVLFNLIDNAIKFTPTQGRVEVTGVCDDQQVRLTVADTGIGIDPHHLPRVFDRFYRADPSRSDPTSGTGLGLAICRSIMESHQGEISVSSILGKGSSFTVTLPLLARSATIEVAMEDQDAHASRPKSGQLSQMSS